MMVVVLRREYRGVLSGGYIYMYVFPLRDGGGGVGVSVRLTQSLEPARAVALTSASHDLVRVAVADRGAGARRMTRRTTDSRA